MLRRRLMSNFADAVMRIRWEVITGTWNSTPYSWSTDGLQWTCVSPGTNGMTVLRCHIYNFNKSLIIYGKSDAESTFDYLIAGAVDVDLSNTITLWNASTVYTNANVIFNTRGRQGSFYSTYVNNPISNDTRLNHHFIDFMFGKDNSTDVMPDNATVYVDIM